MLKNLSGNQENGIPLILWDQSVHFLHTTREGGGRGINYELKITNYDEGGGGVKNIGIA